MTSLTSELCLLPPRLSSYAAGLALTSTLSSDDMPCWELLAHALRLFDAYLLGRWGREQGNGESQRNEVDAVGDMLAMDGRRDSFAQSLVALCVAADLIARDPTEDNLGGTGALLLPLSRTIFSSF